MATVNKKVNSLQSFNNFLIDNGYMTEQIIDLKKDKVKVAQGSEHEVEVLTEKEAEQLLFHIQDERKVCAREIVYFYFKYLLRKTIVCYKT